MPGGEEASTFVMSVTAVIVTHNRVALLRQCLAAVARQTVPPERVVVVDNASTDGTASMLEGRDDVDVRRLEHNTGGAGGFAAGIECALERATDAVWLLDDDTIPEPDALAELVGAALRYPDGRPAVVASRVVWTDGRDHPMNTPRTRPRATTSQLEAAAAVGARPIRSASFVSVLIDRTAIDADGLPVAAYFLWNDDFEYTTRLLRQRAGIAVPSSVVVHKTTTFGGSEADPGERFFYEVRNKVWMFTRSRSLSPSEKLGYGVATLNRWAQTLQRSRDRRLLLRGLREGLRAALDPPATTARVLDRSRSADAGPPGLS